MSIARALLEFLDAPTAVLWSLTPEEAVAFLEGKGLKPTFDYREMLGEEHARAFTVAKMMDTDLLADVKASLDDAVANGVPFKEWADTIIPKLQAKGWWGRKAVTDPLTGQTIVAQLGSPSRLQTIYRTNMQSAYAAGNWDAIVDQAEVAPLLLYDAVDDFRTRPAHHAWDNTLLPVTDPWWHSHYPPNGWNCRCSVIQLSEDEAAELGLTPSAQAPNDGTFTWQNPATGKTSKIPNGLDPGWDANVGIARQKLLAKAVADKLASYPAALEHAAAAGLKLAQDAGAIAAKVAMTAPMVTAAEAAAAVGKAQERAAQKAIQHALDTKVPFLHKAIKQVQATKAGQAMSAKELHQAALAKAAITEQTDGIYQWKVAYAAGKKPPPKAQAIFDKLDEAVQIQIKTDIDVAKAAAEAAQAAEAAKVALEAAQAQAAAEAAANAAAVVKLAQLETGTQLEKATLQAVVKALGPGAQPSAILEVAEKQVAQVKANKALQGVKAATKKTLVDGKIPSPVQVKYLDSLDPDAKAAFLAEVDSAKAKLAVPDPIAPTPVAPAATATAELDTSGMVQIGPQKGSNAGGLFQDPTTGEKWYIKTPASLDHARNEVLASQLYQLAGAQVPELRLTTLHGKPAVASRFEEGLSQGTGASLAKTAGAKDFFAVDAWLGNWDVGGASLDNLLVKNGQAFRVDVGGSLRYRAQGGLKGSAWGDTVTELDSLRNASTNPQTAKVFGGMTESEIKASATRLLGIDRQAVDHLVDLYGPLDDGERLALKATLRARLDNIGRQLKLEAKAAEHPAPPLQPGGKHVTAEDFTRIREARANGYTISTDGSQIEDHQVLLQHYTDPAGKPRTRLVAKLRADGAAKALAKLEPRAGQAGASVLEFAPVREKALALAKSINSRAAKGAAWDDTINTRLADWHEARTAILARSEALDLDSHASVQAMVDVQKEIRAWLADNGPGQPLKPIAKLDIEAMADAKIVPKKTAAPGDGFTWTQERNFTYKVATFDRGNMVETKASQSLPAVNRVLVGEGPQTRVRFVADHTDNSVSSRGLVHIDVEGNTLASAEKAIATLADMGVTTTRTTEGERVGLYLDKLLNLRTLRSNAQARALREKWQALEAVADEVERNKAKLALINKEAGYDVSKSPHWNPNGTYQAFGHGRTLQIRPDLDGPDMADFERTHSVYTNVTGLQVGAGSNQWERLLGAIDGGGQLSSQMERARRGLPSAGSSVGSDHQRGGANYVFTRILRHGDGRYGEAGVYFKPSILRRVDAFSYPQDNYGAVDAGTQATRAFTPDGFAANARNSGNETNFRDSISLFDELERIVFSTKAEAARAIADMKARGYNVWPDGRPLADVLQGPKR